MVSSPEGMPHAPPSTLRSEQSIPNSTCPKPPDVGRICSQSEAAPSLPAPRPVCVPHPRHVLTAEAGTNDENDEADDGGDQGDDHDLAPVASQVEDVHPLAASPRVASFAPAPWYRGRRGGGPKNCRGACAPLLPLTGEERARCPHHVPTGSGLHTSRSLLGHEEAASPFDTVVLVLLWAPGEVTLSPQLRHVPWG